MPFLTTPILRVGDGLDDWTLVVPLVYESRAGRTYTVPPDFTTDLASIPRLAQPLVPVNGRHRAAAILHDWLYATQTTTRAEADRLFLEAMADSGVGWVKRQAMYAAVRVGGWVAWRRHAQTAQDRVYLGP